MLKIGITGSIGSGKSTVCHIFETLGIPVYNADKRGKYLQEHDPAVKSQIVAAFGAEVYHAGGQTLNTKAMADIVFKNVERLTQLESIIHPAVQQDFRDWVSRQQAEYVVKEAALLFEAGSYLDLDKIIAVTAPEDIRLKRVQMRDHISEEQVKARMNRQWPDEKKTGMADFILYNDDRQLLLPQVLRLHKIFSGKLA